MNRHHHLMSIAAISVAAALGVSSFAVADDAFIPLQDDREVSGLVSTTQCPENPSAQTVTPRQFEPFEHVLHLTQACATAVSISRSTQSSTVDAAAITGTGSVLAEVGASQFGGIHSIPRSELKIEFELTEAHEVTIDGNLTAFGIVEPPLLVLHAMASITDISGTTHFQRSTTDEHHAGGASIDFDETFVLEPGIYTLDVTALALVDGGVDGGFKVHANYDVDLSIGPAPTTPGDLTGDGTVGIPDLLILIGAWGACADCDDCPADLTGDCAVGVADLLILISNWTG